MAAQQQIPIWLDCDPGHDDAFAILLSIYHPSFHLLGISTVHGNTTLPKATNNALSVLTAIGKPDFPVIPGADRPFCRLVPRTADNIHGESGLAGTELLPEAKGKAKTDLNAIQEMYKALMATPANTAWVIATGPCTNIALLFSTYPEVAKHIAGLSIMGGAIGSNFTPVYLGPAYVDSNGESHARSGNRTPFAEFNVWADPESARMVLIDPVLQPKTTLIPLDLTHQAYATEKVRDMLLHGVEGQTRMRTMFYELLMFYAQTYNDVYGLDQGPPLHDSLAVGVLLSEHQDPKVKVDFNDNGGERFKLDVLLEGEQKGRTVATLAEDGKGVRIPRSLNLEKFWDTVELCMAKADKEADYVKLN